MYANTELIFFITTISQYIIVLQILHRKLIKVADDSPYDIISLVIDKLIKRIEITSL